MKTKLIATLAAVGRLTETWKSPDGSTVLVLPYGGRILGLFANESEENFLWTNPELEEEDSARTFYASFGWHNSGGDRTWLSPEVDFFFPKFPRVDEYVQPREFDPGSYTMTRRNGKIVLVNRCTSTLSRSGATVNLTITKHIDAAIDPLRLLYPAIVQRVSFAGYTLSTSLQFVTPQECRAPVSLWSLLQMPHGGDFLISTFSKTSVRNYMGEINPEDLRVTDRLVRYRTRNTGEHKIGLHAPTVAGRAGYFLPDGDSSTLVIRNFAINPSGAYVDVPSTDTECVGAAVEACSVNSGLGQFSELEYHVPAIDGLEGNSSSYDISQVWAYRGREDDMVNIARLLIGPDV